MEDKLIWENGFKEQFHPSWERFMKSIIESPEMWEIMQFLKFEAKRGVKLCPLSKDLFACFQVDLDKLKVIVMGMDVYPQYYNNRPASNGIAFDCTFYGKQSSTMIKLYDAIENDCYEGLSNGERSLSLQYLVNQGVMLTNASLSTAKDKSGSHLEIWKPFWKLVFEQCFSILNGMIFIFMGKNAQFFEAYTTPFSHYILSCEHPVASSYQNREFIHENVFSKANKLIESNNGSEFKIEWMNIPEQIKSKKIEHESFNTIKEDDLPW